MARRLAILIGNQTFREDSGLPPLHGPLNDVAAMARLLGDKERGNFDVRSLPDRPHHEITVLIEEELRNRGENELVLIYYSGHGKPDIKQGLCLATADTRERSLLSTSIPAYHLLNIVEASFHNQVIIILDCCYSALIGAKGEPSDGLLEKARETSGLFIVTSSDKLQISREEAAEQDGPVLGVFTSALLRIAESESAANDEGEIRLRGLVEALQEDPKLGGQNPKFSARDASGDPLISQLPGFGADSFDPDLPEDLKDPRVHRRLGAVRHLGQYLRTGTRAEQAGARRLLNARLAIERDYLVRPEIEQALRVALAPVALSSPPREGAAADPASPALPAQPASPDNPGRPAWASEFGRDEYGAWASFTAHGNGRSVIQRLRWCPRGEFRMGSPEKEWGRFADEGPQHMVRIPHGFWLFDTPCTQALWVAVMGTNNSGFKGDDRPVENVTFADVDEFLGRVNTLLPGLNLSLPSEARWEYACRAGTITATYTGDLSDDEAQRCSRLDAIAWWKGNSGSMTHPVAAKAPNGWGLHDMLGNVREWCADHWHGNYEGAPDDGSAWTEPGGAADRVIRGGSWYDDSRFVRSAYRSHLDPAYCFDILGFRCARVQAE
jgi:formylglycine-generating enzyme required for sulfatase activity